MSALLRSAQGHGGFGAVLRKGDPDRGIIVLILASRGEFRAAFEGETGFDGGRNWRKSPISIIEGSADIAGFLEKRARFDPDFWVIELDIPDSQRFTDEMGLIG